MIADYHLETVTVKHLGGNPSIANKVILKNDSYVLKEGQVLELLVGQYGFKVDFESPPSNSTTDKRKTETSRSVEEEEAPSPKRLCKDNTPNVSVKCDKNMWEKVDNGKLYVFTSVGVTSSSKVRYLTSVYGEVAVW